MDKVIYDTCTTRVTKNLVALVQKRYKERKKKEPKLRMIDVWKELEGFIS